MDLLMNKVKKFEKLKNLNFSKKDNLSHFGVSNLRLQGHT